MNLRSHTIAFWLLAAGFFTCTWDLLLTVEAGGFTFKIYQLFFLAGFAVTLGTSLRSGGIRAYITPLFRQPFAFCFLGLAAYHLLRSPWSAFPLKTALYAAWIVFDVVALWLTVQHVARQLGVRPLLWVAWITLLFLSLVILADNIAYHFGYTGGWIGHNQDILLHWGVSRPHAFSYEPSYVAAFLCLGAITCGPALFAGVRRRVAFLVSAATVLLALVSTTSRTGWVGLGLGELAYGIIPAFAGKRPNLRFLGIIAALTAALAAIFVLTMPAQQRQVLGKSLVFSVLHGTEGSGSARLESHRIALQLARETHWLGTGLGASYRYYLEHVGEDPAAPGQFSKAHYGNEVIMSTWGQVVAEGGIPCLLLFALSGWFLLRSLWAKLRAADNKPALGAFCAVLVFYGLIAFSLGNIARGDVWVWYALWSAVATYAEGAEARA